MGVVAAYFEAKPSYCVHRIGSYTVLIKWSGPSNHRMTAPVSVRSDWHQITPFWFLCPSQTVELKMFTKCPLKSSGCVSIGTFLDGLKMYAYMVSTKLRASGGSFSKYFVLLDDFTCHEQANNTESLESVGTSIELIEGGYKCVLQPF